MTMCTARIDPPRWASASILSPRAGSIAIPACTMRGWRT
jgi:hypothetical protein